MLIYIYAPYITIHALTRSVTRCKIIVVVRARIVYVCEHNTSCISVYICIFCIEVLSVHHVEENNIITHRCFGRILSCRRSGMERKKYKYYVSSYRTRNTTTTNRARTRKEPDVAPPPRVTRNSVYYVIVLSGGFWGFLTQWNNKFTETCVRI